MACRRCTGVLRESPFGAAAEIDVESFVDTTG